MKSQHLFAAVILASSAALASAESPVNYPDNHADEVSAVPAKTRAQVKAELAEARRLGLIAYGELGDAVSTPQQERLIAEAGRRAAEQKMAAK